MPDKGKKILILGNGFDLAHGLPTKYSHFLNFCFIVERVWAYATRNNKQSIGNFKSYCLFGFGTYVSAILTEFCDRIIRMISNGKNEITSDNPMLLQFHNLLDDNIWYEYFIELFQENCVNGENWIDFESEIRFVIKEVDKKTLSLTNLWDDVQKKFNDSSAVSKFRIFSQKLTFDKYRRRKGFGLNHKITVKDFREKVFEDLERLTRALELYLTAFVEKIPIKRKIPEISNLSPDYVINFNYTDTYERIYKSENVYHIHGRADANRPAKENDMVLGIDEYWTEYDRDEKTNFTIFKKFAQRIQKHTGNEIYKYLEEIQTLIKKSGNIWSGNATPSKDHPDGISYIYVFGHSLDVTDKDILSSFIGDHSTSVTVYCMDKKTEGELITNTIKLIGEKKLLDKSNHVPPKLNYVIQEKTTYNN